LTQSRDVFAGVGEGLAALCKRLEVDKNEIIAEQGAEARSMHFILDGRLIRVRSLGPLTTIGEMVLITKRLRRATIQAEMRARAL
jgi:hypothetical protein